MIINMRARPSIPAIQGSSTECDFHGPSVQDVMSVLGACRVAIEHVVIFFGIVKGWCVVRASAVTIGAGSHNTRAMGNLSIGSCLERQVDGRSSFEWLLACA